MCLLRPVVVLSVMFSFSCCICFRDGLCICMLCPIVVLPLAMCVSCSSSPCFDFIFGFAMLIGLSRVLFLCGFALCHRFVFFVFVFVGPVVACCFRFFLFWVSVPHLFVVVDVLFSFPLWILAVIRIAPFPILLLLCLRY